MRNKVLIILILCQATAFSQTCLPEGITFSTQEQIDNFQINFPNCTEIEGDVMVSGDDITNLDGLSVLTALDGHLEIVNNPILTSLSGLSNVTIIAQSLVFDFNYSLVSLDGLNNLTSIGYNLGVGNSASLTSLTGLDNVTYVGGEINIDDNNVLSSLAALSNVTSIGGVIYIDYNISLTSLEGLDNIDAASITGLTLFENISLSTCEVQSVCDYLASPGATILIEGNASGCNSQVEIESACQLIGVSDIVSVPEYLIHPNPVNDKLFISNKNGTMVKEILIYNQLGQTVLNEKTSTYEIDVSNLQQGIYIIEISSNEMKFREKLIIK